MTNHSSPASAEGFTGTRWRHLKRGTSYEVVGVAKLQTALSGGLADEAPMVVYRNEATGKLSVRSVDEFCDGRFERIGLCDCGLPLKSCAECRQAFPRPGARAQSSPITDAITVIRAEPNPFREGRMADGWSHAWATFLNRLGDVDETNELYANSIPAQQPASPVNADLLLKAQAFVDRKYVARADARQKDMGLAYIEAERQDLAREIVRFVESLDRHAQCVPSPPKELHWLGDRESADATRHAADMTGCVMYFEQQSDCLQFMRWVEALSVTSTDGGGA